MVYCAAWGCSNHTGMGKILHRFPRDPTRRKQWEIRVRRKDWTPHNNSYLCSDHFEETQYETGRTDNKRKLKPFAVPTIFAFTTTRVTPRRPPRKRQVSEEPEEKSSKRVDAEHSYCNRSGTSVTQQEDSPSSDHDSDKDEEGTEENEATPDDCEASVGNELPVTAGTSNHDARVLAMEKTIQHLKQALAKERREKRKLEKEKKMQEASFVSLFNQDQLDRLGRDSTRGVKWSWETIKKGLQLRSVCGTEGYELLLAQKQPLPSMRSLRRSLQGAASESDTE